MTKPFKNIENKLIKDADYFYQKAQDNNILGAINSKIVETIEAEKIHTQDKFQYSKVGIQWLLPSSLIAVAILIAVGFNFDNQKLESSGLKYNSIALILEKNISPSALSQSVEQKLKAQYTQEQLALNKDIKQIKNLFVL